MEEAIGRLKTYEERIKYKKGKQVDNQEKLMFTRHKSKRKYLRGRGRGKHRFSRGKSHENFKKERNMENPLIGILIETTSRSQAMILENYNVTNVFKTKKDANGKIIKHKAILVAKGYIQELVIDFEEVSALVARMETIQLLLAIAVNNKWEVHHLDVKYGFLHGDLKEEVYVRQPKGFIKRQGNGKVYRLTKALYGLRQAPRAWNIKLDNTLKSLDFNKYIKVIKRLNNNSRILCSDLIITDTPKKEIDKFKAQMEEKFKMSDLGLLAYYIGIEVTQTSGDILLKQTAYANKILKELRMIDSNETLIPMNLGKIITKIT
nr:ribonuclease H-like domain, reverse transcriptase, RNA-dependent DNA polymerase [Tanacetum cinerariifolium]